MTVYQSARLLHVLIAILGVGQVQRSSLTMCAVIGVIVVLMELKPG